MSARLPFTQAAIERAIGDAQERGDRVVSINATTGVVVAIPGPFNSPARVYDKQRAAEYCRCTVEQFEAFTREGLIPRAATRENKWPRVQLDKALERIDIRPTRVTMDEVYFIEMGRFIKIGFSAYALSRLETLQTATPYDLRLLAAFNGGEECEAQVHRLFAHLRHRGEWFRKSRALLAYIDWIKARKG